MIRSNLPEFNSHGYRELGEVNTKMNGPVTGHEMLTDAGGSYWVEVKGIKLNCENETRFWQIFDAITNMEQP